MIMVRRPSPLMLTGSPMPCWLNVNGREGVGAMIATESVTEQNSVFVQIRRDVEIASGMFVALTDELPYAHGSRKLEAWKKAMHATVELFGSER